MRVLHDRVLVRRAKPTTKTLGGLDLPDRAIEAPMEGEVILVGSGRVGAEGMIPLDVKAGDYVRFSSGMDIEIGGEKLLIMREDDILVVIKSASEKKKAS